MTDPTAPLPDEEHERLPNRPEWAVGDWHCRCGYWGSHGWEGFANHLLAALRAERAAPLDVERLARAIANVRHTVNRNLAFARDIAAEYARLAPATGEGVE
jgi:hypothetical protein